jgi:hypothetical protein
MKLKATRIIKFQRGTGFEDLGWHIAHNPTGVDMTLCGLAHEGACEGPTIYEPTKAKEGRPTCENCIRIIKYAAELLS